MGIGSDNLVVRFGGTEYITEYKSTKIDLQASVGNLQGQGEDLCNIRFNVIANFCEYAGDANLAKDKGVLSDKSTNCLSRELVRRQDANISRRCFCVNKVLFSVERGRRGNSIRVHYVQART